MQESSEAEEMASNEMWVELMACPSLRLQKKGNLVEPADTHTHHYRIIAKVQLTPYEEAYWREGEGGKDVEGKDVEGKESVPVALKRSKTMTLKGKRSVDDEAIEKEGLRRLQR